MSGDEKVCTVIYSEGGFGELRKGWWWRFSDKPDWYGPFAAECDAEVAAQAGCNADPTPDDTAAPAYYVEGRNFEPHRVISDWGLNFNLGSVVKYISRFGRKEDDLKDLRKARQFLDFEIERLEKT